MADKLVDDASCAKDGEVAARKPWSTPCVILSTIERTTTAKPIIVIGDRHVGGTSTSATSTSEGGAS